MTSPHNSPNRFSRATILLALVSVPVACKKADEAPEPAAVSVQAVKAERRALTEFVSGEAVLAPLAQSALVSKISSPVQRFLVQRGDRVRKGQLLAVLENRDLAAAAADSKGSLTQAQAAYDISIQAQIPEDRQKAQLDVEQARANLDVAKSVADARKHLLEQGAIPRRDFDTASASYVQAQAAFDIAEHHLASLQAVGQKATIASAAGVLDSARGKYQEAEAGLGYSELRSPIDGVVTDRPLFAGEMAQAGQPVLTVMDTSSLIAKVHLSQAQAQSLKVGAAAKVTIAGLSGPVAGRVSLVSPALDAGSTTLEVWVAVPNKDGALKAGTPAQVRIAVQTLDGVVTVPNESIVKNKSGGPAVMVVDSDSIAHLKPVKLGITDSRETQIVEGVKEGDQIVTTGAYGMDDGTKVKVTAPGALEEEDSPTGAAK